MVVPGGLGPLDVGTIQIPYHFRCPISLELMSDPVTISTGQTYDRSSIESWVTAGHTTCPVTRTPLSDPIIIIPNHTLRRLIQDWCVSHRSSGVQRIPTPKQPAEPSLLRSLLRSAASSSSSSTASLRRLRSLARESDKNRSALISLNAKQILFNLVFAGSGGDDSFSSSESNHDSLAVLALLIPISETESSSIASNPARIAFLVSLLFHSSIEVRVNSAALIESIATGIRSPELRAEVSNAEGVFEGIVEILRWVGTTRALKVGIKALFALCLVKQTRHKAVTAGAPHALVDRLADFEKCDSERALATVELLCRIPEGCAAFAAHALTVPLLVKTILKVSERATEYAAGALLALCTEAEEAQREAVAAGVMTQLLLLVQSECTERAKRKAQLLLKLLRDSWPEDSIANSDDFACSHVFHFS